MHAILSAHPDIKRRRAASESFPRKSSIVGETIREDESPQDEKSVRRSPTPSRRQSPSGSEGSRVKVCNGDLWGKNSNLPKF